MREIDLVYIVIILTNVVFAFLILQQYFWFRSIIKDIMAFLDDLQKEVAKNSESQQKD